MNNEEIARHAAASLVMPKAQHQDQEYAMQLLVEKLVLPVATKWYTREEAADFIFNALEEADKKVEDPPIPEDLAENIELETTFEIVTRVKQQGEYYIVAKGGFTTYPSTEDIRQELGRYRRTFEEVLNCQVNKLYKVKQEAGHDEEKEAVQETVVKA